MHGIALSTLHDAVRGFCHMWESLRLLREMFEFTEVLVFRPTWCHLPSEAQQVRMKSQHLSFTEPDLERRNCFVAPQIVLVVCESSSSRPIDIGFDLASSLVPYLDVARPSSSWMHGLKVVEGPHRTKGRLGATYLIPVFIAGATQDFSNSDN